MPQLPFYPALGTPFIELKSIDSTNNYALQQVHAGMAQHGAAFFAHEQVAGKGQRGKVWSMDKGVNLILSTVINPHPLSLAQQFQLSACVALAAADLFNLYAGEDTRIKWPNDLYWQDRKAGGILIENVIGGNHEWKWAVAGIGININQTSFPASVKNPVSLKQITGKNFDPADLARELCNLLDERLRTLRTSGFDTLYDLYLNRLYKKSARVKLKKDNRIFEALIKTVNKDGLLVTEHGIEEEFRTGEIEWVIEGR
ncbi:biotin--[acetyl-CoA-carboxylase] ligase [Terrimonas sp. NA20]|uniref:Biotin--[acetyl-CoA-carboxylase] ligase n=1 Tax=Terrimonas ginsenosidimutans TaxID=2908004 RepID=A0ABS9KQ64_9BACT|nr:biotin--[acetyl-CoA-carboxylase] ligase [Terrimonas ginsenosidimutans]MCG2614446.1 biotin--[acetyl-CoA-carboxylase] ligase [Terrimonas ginsenosidimutans]